MFIPLYDHNPLNHIVRPFANWTIIAVTILVFVVMQSGIVIDDHTAAIAFGAIPAVISDYRELPAAYELVPATTTLVTYAFLHASWMHLIGNMLFLWVFGDNIEDAVGHIRYVLFYVLTAAGGAVGHILVQPHSQAPLIGASGAVAGIVSAYLLLHPRVRVWILVLGRIPLPLPALWVLGAWIAWQFLQIMLLSGSNVAWWAHIGGIVSGAVLILVLRRPGVKLFDRDLASVRG